jgi:putative endonuclease
LWAFAEWCGLADPRPGGRAEQFAALWLWMRGFDIIGRRYRRHVGEIDIIARRGRLLAFVEVKYRRDPTLLHGVFRHGQRRRIVRAAHWFLKERPQYRNHDCRFDLITIHPWSLPRHIPDAWRADGCW